MFVEKLNKKIDGSVYVIEEEHLLSEGRFEEYLQHDNVNTNTIKVYTGPKLTGDEIANVIISKPKETPWKTLIKVFAQTEKIYITYETTGDTVEADDINDLQQAAQELRDDVKEYQQENSAEILQLKSRMGTVESVKATQTYVDVEMAKKSDKSNTYTKTETDQRIQAVINAAPAALDTLKEIADALNNDPDFAGTMTAQLAGKVDKVSGKGLSTEDYTSAEKAKLAGIEANANKYTHPATHSPSIIAQDSNNRFVTDAEKAVWNGKANTTTVTTAANGLMSKEDKGKLDGIDQGANNYTHPTTHPASMITGLPTKLPADGGNSDTVNGFAVEKDVPANAKFTDTTTTINGKTGSIAKADIVALGIPAQDTVYTHPVNHPPSIISQDANNRFVTDAEKSAWNAKEPAFSKNTAFNKNFGATAGTVVEGNDVRLSNARPPTAHNHDDRYYTETEADTKFATKAELGNAGYGDMLKSIYDTDGDGIIDNAKRVNGRSVDSDVPANAKFTDTVYTHPTTSGNKHIPAGGASGQILRWSADGTAAWGTDNNTTYSKATTSADGLMSKEDKVKLDGITFPTTWGKLKGV